MLFLKKSYVGFYIRIQACSISGWVGGFMNGWMDAVERKMLLYFLSGVGF